MTIKQAFDEVNATDEQKKNGNGSASYGPAYLISGVLYFCLCFPLSTWARRYEERLKRQDSQLSARPTGKEAAA